MNRRSKIFEARESEFFIDHRGEITNEHVKLKTVEVQDGTDEPNYVKLYLDTIIFMNKLPQSTSPILLEILKSTTYADNEKDGGQVFLATPYLKKRIATRTGKSVRWINSVIRDLASIDCLIKLDSSTYLLNPNMFGKGRWRDIKKLRIQLDVVIERQKINGNGEVSGQSLELRQHVREIERTQLEIEGA